MSPQRICLLIAFILALLVAIGIDTVSIGTLKLGLGWFAIASFVASFWHGSAKT